MSIYEKGRICFRASIRRELRFLRTPKWLRRYWTAAILEESWYEENMPRMGLIQLMLHYDELRKRSDLRFERMLEFCRFKQRNKKRQRVERHIRGRSA